MTSALRNKGAIPWMARNSVAANLLMLVLVVGGILLAKKTKQEVFPELELGTVAITVAYPGASPEEVEQGVIRVIEESVRSLDGVKRIRSTAQENVGTVRVQLLMGTDRNKALAEVKAAVDRVRSFPQDVERPMVALASTRRDVIKVLVYGDVSERVLRSQTERVRDEVLALPEVTQVELSGARPPEVSVEVPKLSLRAHGISLQQVAQRVRQASRDIGGGTIRTPRGEVLLKTDERRDVGPQFAEIHLLSSKDGGHLTLGDVAEVTEGFVETDEAAFFNGQRAMALTVYRMGHETPLGIARAVKQYIETISPDLPDGIGMVHWEDKSEAFADRVDLLLRNAWLGLSLVLFILGMFLELRLAFWVAAGIFISFLGGFLLVAGTSVSINMISLFGFILALGIVVDDAIVVGESVFDKRRAGLPPLQAAIEGCLEVAGPVVFSVLTTIAAFVPMLFVPGIMGQIFTNIPVIVIAVLAVSLIESLFVLPAHLGHLKVRPEGRLRKKQKAFSQGVERFIEQRYQPLLRLALEHRWTTLALSMAVLLISLGAIGGGIVQFTFMPKIEMDAVRARVRLPFGAPIENTRAVHDRLVAAAQQVIAEAGGPKGVSRGVFSVVGNHMGRGGPARRAGRSGSHRTEVRVALVRSEQRQISGKEFARRWREAAGEFVGVEHLSYRYSMSHGGGSPIEVRLNHPDADVLKVAANDVAAKLREFEGVVAIDNGLAAGKPQLDIRLEPEARALGLTEVDVGRQVRAAFYGAEALRLQRGRDEVRVMVRMPEADRRTEHSFEQLLLRTPAGGEVPLARVATVKPGRADERIERENGRRVIRVTADVIEGKANARQVLGTLGRPSGTNAAYFDQLRSAHGALGVSLEGQSRGRKESLGALGRNYLMAMLVIFALLAIPFGSYAQPLIVMSCIPFGIVGAVGGHLLFGYDLSLISMMGIVALSGIVVNDSLVLVVAINRLVAEGLSQEEAVIRGAARRFRPIVLTSLTTFFGLLPMIFETSMQARFLIPMAVSLGFGLLFATVVVLFQVPALYVLIGNLRMRLDRSSASDRAPSPEGQPAMS